MCGLRAVGPHHVTGGVVEQHGVDGRGLVIDRSRRKLVRRGEHSAARRGQHECRGRREPLRKLRAGLFGQREFADDGTDSGVHALRVRQQLRTDPGARAVRADDQVRLGSGAVREVQADPLRIGLVTHEFLVVPEDSVQSGRQHLVHRNPADRMVRGGRVRAGRSVEGRQLAHLLGDEAERPLAYPRRGQELLPRLRREAFVQRGGTHRRDVHAVALQALGPGAAALVHRHLDSGPRQAVRQAQPAGTAAHHRHLDLLHGHPLSVGLHNYPDG